MSTAPRLTVVMEAGALRDGRSGAGIGRYVRALSAELALLEGLDLHLSIPTRPPRSERHHLRYLHSQPALVRSAIRHRPQLVHGVTNEPVMGWPLGHQVVTVHDVIPWTSLSYRGGPLVGTYFAVQRQRLRRCAAIIVPGTHVARQVASSLGIRESRIAIVPDGVEPIFQSVPHPDDTERRARSGVDGAPYVLWTGSLVARDPRKALDTLLQAVAGAGSGDTALCVVMAGATGPEAERVQQVAAALGVRLVLPGFVSDADLAALHRGAVASVVPSLDEGFGLPALEALATGAPLVASRAGNLPELVGDAALLVDPGDPRALAGALSAIRDPQTAQRLRSMGPRRAAAFTWRRAAEETLAVYRHAASGLR